LGIAASRYDTDPQQSNLGYYESNSGTRSVGYTTLGSVSDEADRCDAVAVNGIGEVLDGGDPRIAELESHGVQLIVNQVGTQRN
jgi:hypothetical protein